jgi:hypothetical protein
MEDIFDGLEYVKEAMENLLMEIFDKLRDTDAIADACPDCKTNRSFRYYYITYDNDYGEYSFCVFPSLGDPIRDEDFTKTPEEFQMVFLGWCLALWPKKEVMNVLDWDREFCDKCQHAISKKPHKIDAKELLTDYRKFLNGG